MVRNVIVTGAASGIGFETAKQFLALGDRVFMTLENGHAQKSI